MIKSRFVNYLVPGGIVGVTMLAGGILTLPGVLADGNDTSVSTATVTVPVACTMEGTTGTAHTAEIPNGIDSRSSSYYPNGIGTTTLKAYCNDNEGFAVYAVGYTGDTIGNTYLRDSNLGQTADIATGTADSGGTSSWSMKIGVTTGTYTPIIAGSSSDTERQSGDIDYSGWAAVPSAYARVAYRNSGTDISNGNVSAEGASLTTTYAAYISPTQQSGNYAGKVKYTLVHPANEIPLSAQATRSGRICYYPNGGNVEGAMGCQTIPSSGTSLGVTPTSAVLLASNYSREGYGFAGWSTTYDYSDDTGFLGPQEYITFTEGQYSGSNPGLSLYAHWVRTAGDLQSWSGCSSLTSGAVTALKDRRDNEVYAVAKLADGNCWMIENLRLENTNSDNATGAMAQGYGGQFVGLADPETSWMTSTNYTTPNSLYSTDGANNTINLGTNDAGNRIPHYNNTNTPTDVSSRPQGPTKNSAINSTSNAGMYSYGNYYTWSAAIADTSYYNDSNQSITTTSICPSGWHLPQSGSKANIAVSDFWKLSRATIGYDPANFANDSFYYTGTSEGTGASDAMRAYPNNFVYSSKIDQSIYNRGFQGHYWSSTGGLNNYGYCLYLDSSTLAPAYALYRHYGGTVRCMISGT